MFPLIFKGNTLKFDDSSAANLVNHNFAQLSNVLDKLKEGVEEVKQESVKAPIQGWQF
jgi:hypothetical protein